MKHCVPSVVPVDEVGEVTPYDREMVADAFLRVPPVWFALLAALDLWCVRVRVG
ncbi:hypothetical protein [Streptomyces sp. NPDC058989]|uniref:hypothetical protein n=1 Tax=Streptomyces sp. NPDC058989 TaxID=3346686 RepID=UPI0036994DAA